MSEESKLEMMKISKEFEFLWVNRISSIQKQKRVKSNHQDSMLSGGSKYESFHTEGSEKWWTKIHDELIQKGKEYEIKK